MLREFYENVLPPAGRYCLYLGRTKQHLFASSIDELVSKTEKLGDKPDVYFGLASLGAEDERTYENALERQVIAFDIDAGPAKVEKHGDKVYATQEEAIEHIVAFCKHHKFLPSYVLSSGAGLHVYFRLSRPLPAQEWKPLAAAVRSAAQDFGIKVDAAPTVNFVLVLRPPGTMHKSGARVEVLQHINVEHDPDVVRTTFNAARPARKSINDDVLSAPVVNIPRTIHKIVKECGAMGHVAGARGDVAEPLWRMSLGIAKHCIEGVDAAHALSQGHPDYDADETEAKYNRWDAGPSTCESFEGELRDICRACPHYGKIKSPIVLGTVTSDDMKPGDETIIDAATAPAVPALPAPEASLATSDDTEPVKTTRWPWDGYLPEGVSCTYIDGGWSMFMRHTVADPTPGAPEGATKVISTRFCGVPFWVEAWSDSTHTGDPSTVSYAVYNSVTKAVTRFTMPARTVAKRDTLLVELGDRNIQAMSDTAKKLIEDYVRKSVERVRATGMRPKIAGRFGLRSDTDGNIYFAHGRYLIYGDGTITLGGLSTELANRADNYEIALPPGDSGTWTPEVWDSHIRPRARQYADFVLNTVRPDQREFKLAILAALASPLTAFSASYTPGPGLPSVGYTVSLYSRESGMGKTFCMKLAAMAFGRWEWVRPMNSDSATRFAIGGLTAQAGTLPMFMDEAGDSNSLRSSAADLFNIVKGIGNGVAGRDRARKDGSVIPAAPVCLTNIMATNRSISDLVSAADESTNAALMRMIEIDCSSMAPVDKSVGYQAEARMESLSDTIGCLGALIHFRLAALGHTQANALVADCTRVANEVVGAGNEGRILVKMLGSILAVRRILMSEGIKMWEADEIKAEFKKWYDASISRSVHIIEGNSPRAILSRYLLSVQDQTLITDNDGGRGAGGNAAVVRNSRIPNQVTVRVIENTGVAYVDTPPLRDWCREQRINPRALIKSAGDAGLLLRTPVMVDGSQPPDPWLSYKKLGSGVKGVPRVMTRAITVNLRRLNSFDTGEADLEVGSADVVELSGAATEGTGQ